MPLDLVELKQPIDAVYSTAEQTSSGTVRQRIISSPSASEESDAWTDDDETDLLEHAHPRFRRKRHWLTQRIVTFFRGVGGIFGSDWVVLTLLGIIVALVGFVLDLLITNVQRVRSIIADADIGSLAAYFAWVSFACFCLYLATFTTHHISKHAIGSGIPQMKTLLQGNPLPHYLTMKTLISKFIGLALVVGSGLPVGKEGPFVHMASIVAEQLMRHVFKDLLSNESRHVSILAAACAVGVASNFGAPIGGVLFSLEVTSTYFAVRNYWRGFFASVVGALIFRLLAVVVSNERTITSLFTTQFDEYPFDIGELIAFVILGVLCGVLASFFVFCHRRIIETYDKWTSPGRFLAKLSRNKYFYSLTVAFLIATITFPGLLGRKFSLSQKMEINHLFTSQPLECLPEWSTGGPILVSLTIFVLVKFLLTALATTLPVPAGTFVPVFIVGAGFGRLIGEIMRVWFPNGLHDATSTSYGTNGTTISPFTDSMLTTMAPGNGSSACSWGSGPHIQPGGYAVVGAAALAGSVTHTISTSVIVFELTGQIHHILPVMIAVLIGNAVCQSLSPSIYDSIIQMSGLPYLPELRKGTVFKRTVDKIMQRRPLYVSVHCTYGRIRKVLLKSRRKYLPLVDKPDSMMLLGALHRHELEGVIFDRLMKAPTEDELRQIGVEPGTRLTELVLKQVHKMRLRNKVDLTGIPIDPSPFQIVHKTSLYKIHVLFSTLGANLAFVTNFGRLVGVVGIDQVRHAVLSSGVRRLEMRRTHPRRLVNFSDPNGSVVVGNVSTSELPTMGRSASNSDSNNGEEMLDISNGTQNVLRNNSFPNLAQNQPGFADMQVGRTLRSLGDDFDEDDNDDEEADFEWVNRADDGVVEVLEHGTSPSQTRSRFASTRHEPSNNGTATSATSNQTASSSTRTGISDAFAYNDENTPRATVVDLGERGLDSHNNEDDDEPS